MRLTRPTPGYLGRSRHTDLSEERLLVGQLVLQLVVDVVHRGGLALGAQVALLQGYDPLLHVLFLTHGLQADPHSQSNQSTTENIHGVGGGGEYFEEGFI